VLYQGKIVGSIFAEVDSQHLYVRSIEQQMDASLMPNRGRAAAPKIVIATPYPEFARRVLAHRSSAVASRFVIKDATTFSDSATTRSVATTPIAGRKFAATYLSGPDVALYSMATFSMQLPDGRWLATGHSLGGDGERGLPVRLAYADGRLQGGTIWAHPIGTEFATLTNDTVHGSIIENGLTARFLNARTLLSIDGVDSDKTHRVTHDGGSEDEQISLEYGLLTPLFTAIGSTSKIFSGTARLTLKTADGEEMVFNYDDEDEQNPELSGPGEGLFYAIDSWVYFKLVDVPLGTEFDVAKLEVTLSRD
jgi:hypothetical protein